MTSGSPQGLSAIICPSFSNSPVHDSFGRIESAMDFAALESLIETALATSPFTVSGAGFGSADITTLFSRQLGSDGLTLTDASRQSGSASSIVVQGTLTGPWLGASNLAALATFIVVDGPAEVAAVVTGFPPDWTLPTAFPALQAGWLDSFSCTDAQFTLDS